MMYKSAERLNGEQNPQKKLVDVYMNSISAQLLLRQAASTARHPNNLGKDRYACIERVEQAQSNLLVVQRELDTIKETHKCVTQKLA